jgi:hypothetical protein
MSNAIPEDLKDLYETMIASRELPFEECTGEQFMLRVHSRTVCNLIERIAAAEAERDAATNKNSEIIKQWNRCLDDYNACINERNALQAELATARQTIEWLSAPVSRHNEADGILQRYFITGGRQYRYTKQDATDLEALVKEWIAARKDAKKS